MPPLMLTPLNTDDLTNISPTNSPESIFLFLISILPPICIRISISPDLVGFNPTFFMDIAESLAIKPAIIKNAAEEKSPTTK